MTTKPTGRRAHWMLLLLPFMLVLNACGQPYQFRGTAYDPILPAPTLQGTQGDNEPFDLKEVGRKVKLVFFGYTYCPDVCPLTLANMRLVYNQLSDEEKKDVAVIFVTVDPERDTAERLRDYVRNFDSNFTGVNVPLDAQKQVKDDFKIYAEKRIEEGKDAAATDYFVDHTAVVFLVDKNNDLRAIYPTDAAPTDIVADVQHLLKSN